MGCVKGYNCVFGGFNSIEKSQCPKLLTNIQMCILNSSCSFENFLNVNRVERQNIFLVDILIRLHLIKNSN